MSTQDNLQAAFAGESQANGKYLAFQGSVLMARRFLPGWTLLPCGKLPQGNRS